MTSVDFGKEVKKALIDRDENMLWLCDQVRKKTGLYADPPYLWRIFRGKRKARKIVSAISEILGIPNFQDTA